MVNPPERLIGLVRRSQFSQYLPRCRFFPHPPEPQRPRPFKDMAFQFGANGGPLLTRQPYGGPLEVAFDLAHTLPPKVRMALEKLRHWVCSSRNRFRPLSVRR